MDNTILFLACLIFGWLVLYAYGWKKGFRAGLESERDATARRFVQFRIQRFGDRNGYTTRHERFNELN